MILPCQNYFSFSRCFRDRFVEVSGLGWGLRKWRKRDSPCSMLFIHIRVICNGARNKKPEYTPSPSPAPVALCLALSVSPFLSERKRKCATMCNKHRMRRRSVIGWQAIIQAWPKGNTKSQQLQPKEQTSHRKLKTKSKVIQKSKSSENALENASHFFLLTG